MTTTTDTRPTLTYDGYGINGPDEHRSRIATFTTGENADSYGALFAASPDLLDALETIVRIAKGDMRSGTHYDLKACAEVAEAALVKTRPTP